MTMTRNVWSRQTVSLHLSSTCWRIDSLEIWSKRNHGMISHFLSACTGTHACAHTHKHAHTHTHPMLLHTHFYSPFTYYGHTHMHPRTHPAYIITYMLFLPIYLLWEVLDIILYNTWCVLSSIHGV